MRKRRCGVVLGMVSGLALAGLAAGCDTTWDDYYEPLTDPRLGRYADGGSGDAGPTPECIPADNAKPVADSCGVFVSSSKGSDASGKGTKAAPYKTLGKALVKADGKPVYACGEEFNEAVTVSAKVELFGALNCANGWTYDAAKKTQLSANADAIALTVKPTASSATVNDFAVTSVDATAPGGSSIAAIVDSTTFELVRCDLVAGKGADGAAGAAPTGSGDKGADAPAGMLDGCVATSPNGVFGGQPGNTTCGSTNTSGGSGGNGQNQASGAPGVDADPQPQPNAMTGADGLAGKKQDATACTNGDAGAAGLPGTPGAGAAGLGELSSSGYEPPAATPGQSPGTPGYGGGGGGGAKKCMNGFAGPAGGGGGAGGCGGMPGAAGQSAGSSIGLVSLNAKVSLDAVTITTADGGGGGVGGDGQPGGQGGGGGTRGSSNGDSGVKACDGGSGGQGGHGGSGGGGLGGHSVGIAYKGRAPAQASVTITHSNAGIGGIGGDMDATSPGIVGGDGLACTTLDFADATSCGM